MTTTKEQPVELVNHEVLNAAEMQRVEEMFRRQKEADERARQRQLEEFYDNVMKDWRND